MPSGCGGEGAEQPLLAAIENHELRMPLDPDQERLGGAFDRLNDLVLATTFSSCPSRSIDWW